MRLRTVPATGARFWLAPVTATILVLTFGPPAAGSPPTGVVHGAGSPGAVPNSYLVLLTEAAADGRVGSSVAEARTPAIAGSLADRYGGIVDNVWGEITAFSVKMTHRQATRLAADPAVALVEQDQYLYPDNHVTCTNTGIECQLNPPFHLDRIDQRPLELDGRYHIRGGGSGVDIYIIDSGIYSELGSDGRRRFHERFSGRASWGRNVADGNNNAQDCIGHGTPVAGLAGAELFGVARRAQIIAVKITSGCNTSATTNDMTAGINWAADRMEQTGRPSVANISYGSRNTGFPRVIQRLMVELAIEHGMFFVASAGNDDLDACGHYPGAFSSLSGFVSAGASDHLDRRWTSSIESSNWGSCVSLFAPTRRAEGGGVWSICPNRLTGGCTFGGTSAAAPQVAGGAALSRGIHPAGSPATIESSMLAVSTRGALTNLRGSPNRLLWVWKA